MQRCWAAVLGGCSSIMSGEHAISRNQYGKAQSITVQGFPWCRTPKVIGLASAVAKILCKTHNETLSPLDDAAKVVISALELMRDRSQDTMPPLQFPMRRFAVSGDLFERWVLKTTINLAMMNAPRPKGGIFDQEGRPAARYVEIAFGRSELDPDEGLSWVATVGENIRMDHTGTIAFVPWYQKSDGALVGAELRYHGYRLWFGARGAPLMNDTFRPSRYRMQNVAVEINFTWSRQLAPPSTA